MKRGTMRSRITSGAFFATYLPADSARSSATGSRTPDAASQALEAADDITDEPPLVESRFPDPPLEDESSLELSWENAFRAASVAAPVAAAAADAFNAVDRPEPDAWVSSSCATAI